MAWDGSHIDLLKTIPAERLSEILIVRRYDVGERIFEQDEPTTGLWFVIEGRVAIERVELDGNLTTTGVWSVGDIVGIAGLWDRLGYPASARALVRPTVMGWIARDVVLRLHQEIPAFGLEISRLLAERLRFVQESVSIRQGRPIIAQVASVLWTLAKRMGDTVALTHEDLAHIIGTRRETVTRALRELAHEGVISSRHGTIQIADAEKLAEWITGDQSTVSH
ncbi:MAG: Crp/Fnr family transcriptional regulator [Sulfobacillus acidophilus]|uniref:Crp/Fnr family transcriptional regulator n=1 Tax=Sulfobacillus acidophilus TaxID=53633 RepID=A0A2T2WI72_9FIRM|nr:MAG: Crp/Fnr family transcriptional regulator [Sulfobacillus acidophilus]